MYLDAEGRVIALEAVNEDAAALIDRTETGDAVADTLESLLTAANEGGFLATEATVSFIITAIDQSKADADETLGALAQTANQALTAIGVEAEVATGISSHVEYLNSEEDAAAASTTSTTGATDDTDVPDTSDGAPDTTTTAKESQSAATTTAASGNSVATTTTTAKVTEKTTTATDKVTSSSKVTITATTTKAPVSTTTTTKPTKRTTTTGKINMDQYRYTLPDGTVLWLDADVNVREYTMRQAAWSVSAPYRAVEQEILRLVNVERKKEGLSALSWYEDAYCFAAIRAEECFELFSHTRPNNTRWDTVYTDHNVLLYGTWGENLFTSTGYSVEGIAAVCVESWMNSPGHRANILSAKYTHLAVAVAYEGETITAVQNFFG